MQLPNLKNKKQEEATLPIFSLLEERELTRLLSFDAGPSFCFSIFPITIVHRYENIVMQIHHTDSKLINILFGPMHHVHNT